MKPRRISMNRPGRNGFALVLILAFVVLLTVVVVAFFSRAMLKRETSFSSVNQAKADILAKSALDIVIGDFKQEIMDGSTKVVTSGGNFYIPKNPDNAVPRRAAGPLGLPDTPGPTPFPDPNPNFIRGSIYDNTNLRGASDVNSEEDPSTDGRKVTPARWNTHLLLPRFKQVNLTNTTPDDTASFVAPDWVLMTRNGPSLKTEIGSGANAINNPAPSNGNYVIGRYAYAVYDEGGLLDMNSAGFPDPGPAGFTTKEVSQKGALPLADMTRIPIQSNPSSSTDYLTQLDINKLINWRNRASAKSTVEFGNSSAPSFGDANDNWYVNFADVTTSTSSAAMGFRSTFARPNGNADQAFVSRQQLIKLWSALGLSPNALLYLSTFSRALEQPSFVPPAIKDTNAPKILGPQFETSKFANFRGGNSGYGKESEINPSFLGNKARVTSTFTRNDGTTAVFGEPIVKKRFSLSRLRYLTRTATATKSDAIYKWFGLTRANSTDPWLYDRDLKDEKGNTKICTLEEVAAQRREPDFAELLKAAIQAGSLGKAGPADSDANEFQATMDNIIDFHILQIMANLIDQYDADSFPFTIQAVYNTSNPIYFSGVEDLPYFYRMHPYANVLEYPVQRLGADDKVTFSDAADSNGNKPVTINRASYGTVSSLTAGKVALLFIPVVWNPHAPNGIPTSRPTKFRMTFASSDPFGNTKKNVWVTGQMSNTPPSSIFNPSNLPTTRPGAPITAANSSVEFTDTTGQFYREPTMLWSPTAPASQGVQAGEGSKFKSELGGSSVKDQNKTPVRDRVGLLLGVLPINCQFSYTGDTTVRHYNAPEKNYTGSNNYIKAIDWLDWPGHQAPPDNLAYTITMDYFDSEASRWVTYSTRYIDQHNWSADPSGVRLIVTPPTGLAPVNGDHNFGTTPKDKDPVANQSLHRANTAYDPRTDRWSVSSADPWLQDKAYGSGLFSNPFPEARKTATSSTFDNNKLGGADYALEFSERPRVDRGGGRFTSGITAGYGANTGQYTRFLESMKSWSAVAGSDTNLWGGLFVQNNSLQTTAVSGNSATVAGSPRKPYYYEDPDGVTRRASGGYVTLGTGPNAEAATVDGLPTAFASTTNNTMGLGSQTSQMQNRSIILNRPFKSVADMGYAFRSVPWKNIDFFTPESGDVGLLDVFCIDEPPSDAIVSGKVNINTHQGPVLEAILAGANRDEQFNLAGTSKPAWALKPLKSEEAAAIVSRLFSMTLRPSDTSSPWQGPLTNISELVGRYVTVDNSSSPPSNTTGLYSVKEPISDKTYYYVGLPQALDGSVYKDDNNSRVAALAVVQRFREAAIRPLIDCGQVRVWNLFIDIIAQSGRYPNKTKTGKPLSEFVVEGEKRYWLHVAIDRMTGEVIDQQLEAVNE